MRKKILKLKELKNQVVLSLNSTSKVIGGKGAPVCCGTVSHRDYIRESDNDSWGSSDWSDEGCC